MVNHSSCATTQSATAARVVGRQFPTAGARNLDAFLQGLHKHGYEDGQTIDIVYRWADGDPSRLRGAARELIALSPDVILTASPPGNVVLMQSTATIPIVGALTIEPIKQWLNLSNRGISALLSLSPLRTSLTQSFGLLPARRSESPSSS
jgi:hypothetical protein